MNRHNSCENTTRRRVVSGLGLTCALCTLGFSPHTRAQWPPAGEQPQKSRPRRHADDATGEFDSGDAFSGGCGISSLGRLGGRERLQMWTGNRLIDAAYQREGLFLVQLFQVTAAGSFMDDSDAPNAYATPEQIFPNGPDGTVVFGMSLLGHELERDGGIGLAVPAIMAHEFSHLRQFKDRRIMHNSIPWRELHADFLAGWYLSRRKLAAPTDVRPAMSSFFEMGDYEFNDPNHHGTPDQRLDCLIAGMQSRARDVRRAFYEGESFVPTIFGEHVESEAK